MKTKSEKIKLWRCPKCGREFERKGQTHSCKSFPLEQHFIGKKTGEVLYNKFRAEVKKRVGNFKIESLECCIHFVNGSAFVAIRIFKDKIGVDFSLSEQFKNKRISKMIKMSAHRYLYYIDIVNEDEIDEELLGWIEEAKNKKKEKD